MPELVPAAGPRRLARAVEERARGLRGPLEDECEGDSLRASRRGDAFDAAVRIGRPCGRYPRRIADSPPTSLPGDPTASPRPLALRDRGIVCISSIDWDFLWQGHQEIMSRFAAAGNRVVFVENTGVRSVRPTDAARVVARLVRWSRQVVARPRATFGGVIVVSPLLVPLTRSRAARAINRSVLVPREARRIARLVGQDPVLFSYLPTANAVQLVRALRGPRSVVVYYCVADFGELTDDPTLARSEQEMASLADLIFVQGPELAARFRGLGRPVHQFRAGVDLGRFDPGRAEAPAEEIQGLLRPVIGYSGGVHRHVDIELLEGIATSFEHGSLVLVGPVQRPIGSLVRRTNVHVLGARPPEELPGLVAGFDVGLVPYLRTPYTETVFPTKLFEYLAMGRPVVSTTLPEVTALGLPEFAARCVDRASFVGAVRSALETDRPELAAARRRIAAEHDWARVVEAMAALIARAAP